MAFTHIRGGANSTGGTIQTTLAVTLSGTVGVGNHVCGFFEGVTSGGGTLVSILDDKSNSYTVSDTQVDGNGVSTIYSFYLLNIANAPITITVTIAAASSFLNLVVDEFSGPIDSGGVLHSVNSQLAVGTGTDAVTSGSVTVATAASLAFGMTCSGGAGHVSPGTGFTAGQVNETAGNAWNYSEYILNRGTGAVAGTFTGPSSQDYQTALLVFGPPSPVLLLGQIWM